MSEQDIELADALRERSKEFSEKNEHYNALLDISAAFRLMSFSRDTRVSEVHDEWVKVYQTYTDNSSTEDGESSADPIARLEGLLGQIESRRR